MGLEKVIYRKITGDIGVSLLGHYLPTPHRSTEKPTSTTMADVDDSEL